MLIHFLKKSLLHFPKSFIAALGLVWLFIDPFLGLTGHSINLSYGNFILFSFLVSLLWFIIDGIWIQGFFRTMVKISSNSFDTSIVIKFGDLFSQEGWKAIPVNDFFDSQVDGIHVANSSLHGEMLKRYWGGNVSDWDKQISNDLSKKEFTHDQRHSGKQNRYEIGTTAFAKQDEHRFLCVALSYTNTDNSETKANAANLICAIRGLMVKARSICGNEVLSLPLLGSGLSRTGLKGRLLVNLILAAILEETKEKKVTDTIQIILPWTYLSKINLLNIKNEWR